MGEPALRRALTAAGSSRQTPYDNDGCADLPLWLRAGEAHERGTEPAKPGSRQLARGADVPRWPDEPGTRLARYADLPSWPVKPLPLILAPFREWRRGIEGGKRKQMGPPPPTGEPSEVVREACEIRHQGLDGDREKYDFAEAPAQKTDVTKYVRQQRFFDIAFFVENTRKTTLRKERVCEILKVGVGAGWA